MTHRQEVLAKMVREAGDGWYIWIERSALESAGIPWDSKEYADWLTNNGFRQKYVLDGDVAVGVAA